MSVIPASFCSDLQVWALCFVSASAQGSRSFFRPFEPHLSLPDLLVAPLGQLALLAPSTSSLVGKRIGQEFPQESV